MTTSYANISRLTTTVILFITVTTLSVSGSLYAESTPQDLAKEIQSLKDRINTLEKPGFLSKKKHWFTLSGELELEYRNSRGDSEDLENRNGYMGIDKLVLSPQVAIEDSTSLSMSLLYKQDAVEIDKAYVEFKKLWLDSKLTIGLDDRFFYRGGTQRKTEGSPLIRSAYFRLNEYQLTWSGKENIFHWYASISQGPQLGKKQASEDSSYKFLADRTQDDKGEANQNKALSLGIGIKNHLADNSSYEAMTFIYNSKLTQDDVNLLQGITGYDGSNNDLDKRIIGGYFTYQRGEFDLDTMYIASTDGTLDRNGWYIRTAYKVTLQDRAHFNGFDFVLRYDQLNVELDAVDGSSFSSTATWDRTQTTVAVIIDMYKNTKLKLEYYMNGEETGGDDISNDEFLGQLEVKF